MNYIWVAIAWGRLEGIWCEHSQFEEGISLANLIRKLRLSVFQVTAVTSSFIELYTSFFHVNKEIKVHPHHWGLEQARIQFMHSMHTQESPVKLTTMNTVSIAKKIIIIGRKRLWASSDISLAFGRENKRISLLFTWHLLFDKQKDSRLQGGQSATFHQD